MCKIILYLSMRYPDYCSLWSAVLWGSGSPGLFQKKYRVSTLKIAGHFGACRVSCVSCLTKESEMEKKTRGGRPPKFSEESSPITVTLPHRTVKDLLDIDKDRAKAIVKCVDYMVQANSGERKVDVVKVTSDMALLIVPPSRTLQSIPWLQLIEVAPSRFLLVIPSGTATEALEIALVDLIERLPEEEIAEKKLLTDLRRKLSHNRRQEGLSKGEILFVVPE